MKDISFDSTEKSIIKIMNNFRLTFCSLYPTPICLELVLYLERSTGEGMESRDENRVVLSNGWEECRIGGSNSPSLGGQGRNNDQLQLRLRPSILSDSIKIFLL